MLVRFGAKNSVSLGSSAITLLKKTYSTSAAMARTSTTRTSTTMTNQPNQAHAPHQPVTSCIIGAVASVSWNEPPIGTPAGTGITRMTTASFKWGAVWPSR